MSNLPALSLENQLKSCKSTYKDILYVLSHDLSAPIRHIKEFHKILVTETALELNDSQLECKKFIDQSIDLLESRLDVILQASRLYAKQKSLTGFTPEPVITEVVGSLEGEFSQTKAFIEVDCTLREAYFDESHFVFICSELLTNAFKFQHAERSLKIAVVLKEEDSCFCLGVKDNGIGVEPASSKRVLLPYSRLNGDEYPGLGAGLFLVNVIAELYGGRLSIDTSGSVGCEVIFCAPILSPVSF